MLTKFIRKDKQFILNFAAVLGVGLTMVSTIRDTSKACKIVNDDMTLKDKINKTWKCYIPSATIASSTILCIIYSDYVTMNEKISLLNSLISVQSNYKIFRQSVEETLDDETKDEIMKKTIRSKVPKELYIERTEEKVFYEEFRGKFFTSTIDNVLKAEYLFNKQLSIVGHASLNDLYKLLGISETDSGKYLGWSIYEGYFSTNSVDPWVNFQHKKMEDDDGMEYFYLGYSNQPEVDYDLF